MSNASTLPLSGMDANERELARLTKVTPSELERLPYDVVVKLDYNDPAAQKNGSRFLLIAKCRTDLVAQAVVRDYEHCGWVKGIVVFGPDDEDDLHVGARVELELYGPGPGTPDQRPEGTIIGTLTQVGAEVTVLPEDVDFALDVLEHAGPDASRSEWADLIRQANGIQHVQREHVTVIPPRKYDASVHGLGA